ncbi:MAG TPA: FAD-dependent oxidoreductase [Myxococcota bacterium]|nr:FAD-dependent oxidoreductase [Myxococcota bacterium]
MKVHVKDVIVVGGGIAGLTVAKAVANQGMRVALVEQGDHLGGHAGDWACMATDECARCSACLVQEEIARVAGHPGIELILAARIGGCEGEAGDFRISLDPQAPGDASRLPRKDWLLAEKRELGARALVLATGFEPYDPTENLMLGYGRLDGVFTTRDLDEILRRDDLSRFSAAEGQPLRIAFIQCVGSRDRQAGREYCSQFCCRTTIRLARRLLYLIPDLEITVFYIDLQVMSKEFGAFYRGAREKVKFIQGVPAEISVGSEHALRVYGIPPGSDRTTALEFDRLVLAIGLAPTESHLPLADALGLELDDFGYFPANSGRLLETSRPGIFLAGACAGPSDIQGSRRQALAVAGLLSRRIGGAVDRSRALKHAAAVAG